MEKIETRIENMERLERELWGRLDDIERREEDIEVRLGMKSRISRIYNPEFIKKHKSRFTEGTRKIKRLGSAKVKERRDRLRTQIRDVVKKAKEGVKQEPPAEEGKSPRAEKRIDGERRNILKKQISSVIERYKEGYKEEKEQIPREIKQLKILTGEEASDARVLFELLLKRGSTNVEEAAKELKTQKATIKSWAKDLESSGLIDVNDFAGTTVMKLRDIATAVGENEKKG